MSVVATSIRWARNKTQSPSNDPNASSISVTKGANTIYQRIGVGRVDILSSNGSLECAKRKNRALMNMERPVWIALRNTIANPKRIPNLQSEGGIDLLLLC